MKLEFFAGFGIVRILRASVSFLAGFSFNSNLKLNFRGVFINFPQAVVWIPIWTEFSRNVLYFEFCAGFSINYKFKLIFREFYKSLYCPRSLLKFKCVACFLRFEFFGATFDLLKTVVYRETVNTPGQCSSCSWVFRCMRHSGGNYNGKTGTRNYTSMVCQYLPTHYFTVRFSTGSLDKCSQLQFFRTWGGQLKLRHQDH